MKHTVTLLMTEFVTHDVKRFMISKPQDFTFAPGQGVELAINRRGLTEEAHPFTPTSLPQDLILEFTIKGYTQRDGLTKKLHGLSAGDELLLSEPFGTIAYHGPGVFIAGGAGITPFIAIFRDLAHNNKLADHTLIFSNKTPDDVICEREFRHYLGNRCVLTCTQQTAQGYENRRIDMAFLSEKIKDFNQNFYICGPKKFVENINDALKDLGARPDALIFER
jgi:ferredoxin-NADP reductase